MMARAREMIVIQQRCTNESICLQGRFLNEQRIQGLAIVERSGGHCFQLKFCKPLYATSSEGQVITATHLSISYPADIWNNKQIDSIPNTIETVLFCNNRIVYCDTLRHEYTSRYVDYESLVEMIEWLANGNSDPPYVQEDYDDTS
jgi:hypothetical protein